MPHAIRVHQTGGPEVLQWSEIEVGAPGPGEVRLKQTAVGLNYIDVYHRIGLYPLPLPFVPGMEAAGTVESVGNGVTRLKPGDRVAYSSVIGAYAETRLIAEDRVVKLPDTIDNKTGAAMMLHRQDAVHRARAHARHPQQFLAGGAVHVHRETLAVGQRPGQLRVHVERQVAGGVRGQFRRLEPVEAQQPVGLVQPVLAQQRRGARRQRGRGVGDRAERREVHSSQLV